MKKAKIKKTQNPVVRLKPPLELHERYKNISRSEGFGTVSAWITSLCIKRLDEYEANAAIPQMDEGDQPSD